MIDTARLLARIKRAEGFRTYPYQCPAGKLSIGYGRNLEDVGITRQEAEYLLRNDVQKAMDGVQRKISWFETLDDVRQAVLVEMAYNCGLGGLLTFKKMLTALGAHRYEEAAAEALDSKWARQVGRRATELAKMLRTGEWVDGG